eukprot:6487944-Amphidinium_carterae.1
MARSEVHTTRREDDNLCKGGWEVRARVPMSPSSLNMQLQSRTSRFACLWHSPVVLHRLVDLPR